MPAFGESAVEQAALAWFRELGYLVVYGPELVPGGAERRSFDEVVLLVRLREAIRRLNPAWIIPR